VGKKEKCDKKIGVEMTGSTEQEGEDLPSLEGEWTGQRKEV